MINPGINPASKGTRAVANDQVNTPISRTFLNQKKIKGEKDDVSHYLKCPQDKENIFLVHVTSQIISNS